MGNCLRKPAKKDNTTAVALASPSQMSSIEARRKDLIVLLLGPVGSGAALFVHKSTGRNFMAEPLMPAEVLIQTAELNYSGRNIRLILPTSFDSDEISESAIMDKVEGWLKTNYSSHPFVDRIFYFTEVGNHYKIQPISAVRNTSGLKKLCGVDDESNLYSKILLVRTKEEQQELLPIPKAWRYLQERGVKEHVYEGTEEDAVRIIGLAI